jgi:site-specific DNA recombinase
MADATSAIGYVRVSTDEQAREGVSLADQEQRIREFAAERGWELSQVFADRGVSGSIAFADRPAGGQAFATGVDRIIVAAWDRLSRDAADFLAVARDRQLVSITEDGEPPLLRDLRAVLAQEERRKIAERTKQAAVAIFHQGRYNGPRPLGYEFVDGRLRPKQTERPTVERIYAEFVAGRGVSEITRGLNADLVPTVRGGAWRPATVRSVLTNPAYVGEVRFSGEVREGLHDAILPRETWDKAQTLIGVQRAAPGGGRGRAPKANHLFTRGLLRCGLCGESMVARTNGRYADYMCAGRQIRGCSMPRVKRRDIDSAVYGYFETVGLDVEATRAQLADSRDRKLAEVGAVLVAAETEVRLADERLARIRRDYTNGDLSAADFADFRAELEPEQTAALAEVERLRSQQSEVREWTEFSDPEQDALQRLADIRRAVAGEVKDAAGVDAARAALRRLFERFVLNHLADPDRFTRDENGVGQAELVVGKFAIEMVARETAIAGYSEGMVPVLRRVGLDQAANNERQGTPQQFTT